MQTESIKIIHLSPSYEIPFFHPRPKWNWFIFLTKLGKVEAWYHCNSPWKIWNIHLRQIYQSNSKKEQKSMHTLSFVFNTLFLLNKGALISHVCKLNRMKICTIDKKLNENKCFAYTNLPWITKLAGNSSPSNIFRLVTETDVVFVVIEDREGATVEVLSVEFKKSSSWLDFRTSQRSPYFGAFESFRVNRWK